MTDNAPFSTRAVASLRRTVAMLAVALTTVVGAPSTALAEPGAPTLTWTVQPANASGPDGRRWIELTVDAGQVITEHLAVRNFSDTAAVFTLKAADGYLTDKGRFNMLPSDRASVDGGTWIGVQEKVTVAAKSTAVVPFTITAPDRVAPGDHPAGIAATVTSTGGTVNVESRVGFRVMLRASGTARASLAVNDLSATYTPSWNPFAGGTIRVRYVVANDGNVWVKGAGRVAVSELFGLLGQNATADIEEVLPGGGRTIEARVDGVWALGNLRTAVAVTPALLGGNQSDAEIRTGSATVTTWALPWPQLLLALFVAALLLGLRAARRRRRDRLTQMLARAREEGRAAAQG